MSVRTSELGGQWSLTRLLLEFWARNEQGRNTLWHLERLLDVEAARWRHHRIPALTD